MQPNIQTIPKTLLTIDESAYFEVDKKPLLYLGKVIDYEKDKEVDSHEYVNRYALVRKDTGKLLGIHSDDYIVRPYSVLAEKVNEVIIDAVPDIHKWEITTHDEVYADGKKYRRNINFCNKKIFRSNQKTISLRYKGICRDFRNRQ